MFLHRGYDLDEVDEFVDRVVGALGGNDAVSVEDVRQVPFRPRRGGYREDAVDDAMDRVVEYLLLVRREGTADAEQEVLTLRTEPPWRVPPGRSRRMLGWATAGRPSPAASPGPRGRLGRRRGRERRQSSAVAASAQNASGSVMLLVKVAW